MVEGSWRESLPARRGSVPAARRSVVAQLRSWGLDEVEEEVALACSELVTNALLHGGGELEVRLSHDDRSVRLEVRDGSSLQPEARQHPLDAGTGRGLSMVEVVSSAWGSDLLEGGGKTVWATFAVGAGQPAVG